MSYILYTLNFYLIPTNKNIYIHIQLLKYSSNILVLIYTYYIFILHYNNQDYQFMNFSDKSVPFTSLLVFFAVTVVP